MKKILFVALVVATAAWGIEVGGYLGINTQTWNDGDDNIGNGSGFHGGVLGSLGLTPSCLPVYIGAETGFLVQSASYRWEGGIDFAIKYNNLVIPLLLKATFKPTGKLHIGAGLGPSFIIHTSGVTGIGGQDWSLMADIADEDLKTDVGFQAKADLGFKLAPMLWLKPGVALQLNPNPYWLITNDRRGSEAALLLTVGLVFNP